MNIFEYSNVIIFICVLIIVSYLFNIISKWSKIPSVILLLGTGMLLRYASDLGSIELPPVENLLKILGTIGLIMIVLEGSLDLKISRDKLGLINRSFLSALIVLLLSNLLITWVIVLWLPHASWHSALVYAIPLSVISSAIVIPSINSLSEEKKEFSLYEATFSDILGILLFNFIASTQLTDNTGNYAAGYMLSMVVGLAACIAFSLGLVVLINKITSHAKFFLIYAILILLYVVGKQNHLPSLLLILVFGLIINNLGLITKGKLAKYYNEERFNNTRRELYHITAESSFLIRTFFFILFGYYIDLALLINPDVIVVGSTIVMSLILVRYFYLRFLLNSSIMPELFLIPRGLITIILFFSIPAAFDISGFNEGVISFVILATSLLMMVGLILNRKEEGTLPVMVEDRYGDTGLIIGDARLTIPEDESGIHDDDNEPNEAPEKPE